MSITAYNIIQSFIFLFFYNHGPVKKLLWLVFCNIYSMLGRAEPVKTLKTM